MRRLWVKQQTPRLHLAFGAHKSPQHGMCLMEAVAFATGEPHTDAPRCVDRLLIRVAQRLNDSLGDAERQRLIAYIPRLIDTASDGAHRRRMRLLNRLIENVSQPCGCLDCRIGLAMSLADDKLALLDLLTEAPTKAPVAV